MEGRKEGERGGRKRGGRKNESADGRTDDELMADGFVRERLVRVFVSWPCSVFIVDKDY
jgi:hypothetical protein